MSSKMVPLVIVILIVAVAGYFVSDQMAFDEQAELLSADAQFRQGQMYEEGWGRPKDTQAAIDWYERAAANAHAEAQFRLGNLYYDGKRVQQDLHEAMKWYFMAANNGHHEAEYRLGVMYQNGEGVPINRLEAEKWFAASRQ